MTKPGLLLIVEDDDDNRVMVATLLAIRGYSAVTATNGCEALVLAREHRPCLILLDLMMPVMDGREFRLAQLADPAIADIPVLCLSGHHDASAIARSLKAVGCVQKPVVAEILLDMIQEYCGGRESSEPPPLAPELPD